MFTRARSAVAVLAVAATTVVVPALSDGAAAAAPTCHGRRATIVGHDPGHPRRITGTRGDDVIVGTQGPDVIHARGGDDVVCALGDKDLVFGGRGDDRLYGGHDRTGMHADPDSPIAVGDTINGGPGDDLINLGFDPGQADPTLGRHERDTVSYAGSAHGVHLDLGAGRATGEGHDVIVDRPGFVWFHGSAHDDRILGTSGDDLGSLGRGDDVFRGRAGDDRVNEGSGDTGKDRMFGGPGDDEFSTFSGGDTIAGGPGADLIYSFPGAEGRPADLRGGPGDDVMHLDWILDGDRVSGGDGHDVAAVIFGHPSGDDSALADLSAGLLMQGEKRARIELFESYSLNAFVPLTLHGSDGPDQIIYSAPGLTADLGDGDDVLTLDRDDASDDTVDGGPGTDTVDVGAGDDTCTNVEAGPC